MMKDINYASDLSKDGAEKLIKADLEKQMKQSVISMLLKNWITGNANIIAQGSINRRSYNYYKV